MERAKAYANVVQVAQLSESGGLGQPRAVLLLWFLRNVVGIDDLEAYEYVCDGPGDAGIDGLYLEPPPVDEPIETVVLLQSKFPEGPTNIGVKDIKHFVGTAAHFKSPESLAELLNQEIEPQLRSLINRLDLVKKLQAGHLRHRLVFVTAGALSPEARVVVDAVNRTEGAGYLQVYDIDRLGPIAEAVSRPTTVKAVVGIECLPTERFITQAGENRIAVASVRADQIVDWPGLDDRSLFDLNVRRELRPNRVRNELDGAIKRAADHKNFLAYHNGLTVVCDQFEEANGNLRITNLSVVNGAQSAVSFWSNKDSLTGDLRVLVKFVEVGTESQLAREVGRRSNMQNPVNARNLRALDGRQLKLEEEFRNDFPDYAYVTRPDYSNPPSKPNVIQNDEAAQLLCAVYSQRPWLAVKKLALFEGDTYIDVFGPEITAAHVVLVDLIHKRVNLAKDSFPDEYRRSWQLTTLVAVYLVAQLLRTEGSLESILLDPASALKVLDGLEARIDELVRHAAGTMAVWHDARVQADGFDDFKVEFKREETLRQLNAEARRNYLYDQKVRPRES